MKKVIINEYEKGFLFKNGKYVKLLDAGKYWLSDNQEVEISCLLGEVFADKCPIDTLLKDSEFASKVVVAEIGDQEFGIHFHNGKVEHVLTEPGKHAFWSVLGTHEIMKMDISNPEIQADFPRYLFEKIPGFLYERFEVKEYQKGVLFFDNRFIRLLDAGVHYFWKYHANVRVNLVDTRLLQRDIIGQEILTADKVAVRVNLVCHYRVTDCVKIATEIEQYEEQIHVAAQLALRDCIGGLKLDEILENKDGISKAVFAKLREKESELFIEIKDAGVKDIILPGEVRDIMNTVLVAEKRAQANVITRREEVASTRSLLNTAKLMEENETLYRLKELEFVEKICENVGNINLNGNGDILNQLLGMTGGRK